MDVDEMDEQARKLKGKAYGNASEKGSNITKNSKTGLNSDGSVDCSGAAYNLNNADSDSKVKLPYGTAAQQADAFENAGEAGELIDSEDVESVKEGDYIFTGDSEGNITHVMVALKETGGGRIDVMSASEKNQKVMIYSMKQSGGWLHDNMVGVGRVNRSKEIVLTPIVIIGPPKRRTIIK